MFRFGNTEPKVGISFYTNELIHILFILIQNHFGPSGVRALPLAAGINEGGHYFGPSGLRALLLAAGINVGGNYF